MLGTLRGVAIGGRPVSHNLDDGFTLEITRLATDGTPNCCSALYSAIRRAAVAIGFRNVITYTLISEPGTSLIAAGWLPLWVTDGRSWDSPTRARADDAPTCDKVLWFAP